MLVRNTIKPERRRHAHYFALKTLTPSTVGFPRSGGKAGLAGVATCRSEPTTIGRSRSAAASVMLTSPFQEGATLVVVAFARATKPPAPTGFLRLRANPEGGRSPTSAAHAADGKARVADADERARLWPLVVIRRTRTTRLQTKTSGRSPLVLLENRRTDRPEVAPAKVRPAPLSYQLRTTRNATALTSCGTL